MWAAFVDLCVLLLAARHPRTSVECGIYRDLGTQQMLQTTQSDQMDHVSIRNLVGEMGLYDVSGEIVGRGMITVVTRMHSYNEGPVVHNRRQFYAIISSSNS